MYVIKLYLIGYMCETDKNFKVKNMPYNIKYYENTE